MTKEEQNRSKERAKIIKALSHPSRLFIIEKLYEKPYCVCELTEMIGVDISTVSKHLTLLKNAGLVADEKKGTSIYYSLKCRCIMEFIGCIETVIRQNTENESRCLITSKK